MFFRPQLSLRGAADYQHHNPQLLTIRPPPSEFSVFLNDLPGNDFNTIFVSLPAFQQKLKVEHDKGFDHYFVSGVPDSFYGRLSPPIISTSSILDSAFTGFLGLLFHQLDDLILTNS
ncbi:Probable methyltransferase TCM_000168 [Linum perenne]